MGSGVLSIVIGNETDRWPNQGKYLPDPVSPANISEDIDNLISGGSTATEILMGLRWKFSQFIDENKESNYPVEIRIKIQNLINEISEILDM